MIAALCIDTYLPREGTETLSIFKKLLNTIRLSIATYLPREEPETLSRPRSRQAKHEYQILFNSKGVGN